MCRQVKNGTPVKEVYDHYKPLDLKVNRIPILQRQLMDTNQRFELGDPVNG